MSKCHLDEHIEYRCSIAQEGIRSLQYAAWHGHLQVADQLLSAGASINSPDMMGMTALHFAAWNNHLEVAELLIARGAMVDQLTQVCTF